MKFMYEHVDEWMLFPIDGHINGYSLVVCASWSQIEIEGAQPCLGRLLIRHTSLSDGEMEVAWQALQSAWYASKWSPALSQVW